MCVYVFEWVCLCVSVGVCEGVSECVCVYVCLHVCIIPHIYIKYDDKMHEIDQESLSNNNLLTYLSAEFGQKTLPCI